MEKNPQIAIEDLLLAYCEGSTTEEETASVEQWIGEDAAHRKIVEQLAILCFAADTVRFRSRIDTESSLARVNRRIGAQGRKAIFLPWLSRIAAVLCIPFLMSTLWFYHKWYTADIPPMLEVSTAPGMTTTFSLPDGSKVYLNSSSVIGYPAKFTGNRREIRLSGEAYFEVTKDPAKAFVVAIEKGPRIEVYGTSFNVEAYREDNRVSTTLIEGNVAFLYTDKSGRNRRVTLNPKQKAVYDPEEREATLYRTTGTVETAWKDGKIVFENTPLEEAFKILGKRFHIEFVFSNRRDYGGQSFKGTFTTQRFEKIMEHFRRSSDLHWRYIDNPNLDETRQKVEIY